ncbi:MAG TPA: response regulator [Opitutaceae bacterium]|jgi:DNA-binding NtrC family response regulator
MNKTSPSPTASKPAAPPRWILVVDDEESMRQLIEIVLRREGWTVQTAAHADDAIDLIKKVSPPPSLIICDVLMPRVDGLELMRRISGKIKGLEVIFISGHLSDVSWWPTDLREHRFLAKPFERDQLVSAVSQAMGEPNPVG